MTEEKQLTTEEVIKQTGGRELTPAEVKNQEIMAKLAQGSGEEEQGGGWTFISYITVNNKMVEEKTQDGREIKARCKPEFVITSKEGSEYSTDPFAPEFEGTIIKFMHRVQRKYLQDQTGKCLNNHEFYRSLEFKAFTSDIHIRQNKEFLPPIKYAPMKDKFGEENELWSICYFIVEGEDTVRKAEFKGASRGILYDYMTAKDNHPVAGSTTKFSLEIDNDNANPFNKLVLTNLNKQPADLENILKMQDELNAMIDGNIKPSAPAVSGETLSAGEPQSQIEEKHTEDISVESIPFDEPTT